MTPARQRSLIGLIGALGLHGALLAVLFLVQPTAPTADRLRPPVRIRVLDRPVPTPQPKEIEAPQVAPEPKPAPPPKEQAPKPKTVKRERPRKPQLARPEKVAPPPQPKADPPPPPAVDPPPAAAAQPVAEPRRARKFTVAMEATVPGGGVAVPVSNSGGGWAYGAPDGDPNGDRIPGGAANGDPDGVGAGAAPRPLTAAEATRLPRYLGGPSADELRAAYPEAARQDGREADVGLKILISAAGAVAQVRLVRSAGAEFDQVALALVKRFRFAPGERAGQPAAVWIPWTYKFRLKG